MLPRAPAGAGSLILRWRWISHPPPRRGRSRRRSGWRRTNRPGAQVFLLGSMHAGTEDAVYPEYVMEAYRNSTYAAPELDTVAFSGDGRLVSECAGYLRLDGTTAAEVIPEHVGLWSISEASVSTMSRLST